MSAPFRSSKIIAICGIDGSGKTSLVRRLRESSLLGGASFVKKEQKENFERVLRLAPPTNSMPDAYLRGVFAHASRWAHALDFLRYYEQIVQPLERQHVPLIVSDRWAFCTITFADIGIDLKDEIEYLLRNVPRPDLTIHLDVPPHTAMTRLLARGALAHDESLELLTEYRNAYERYFEHYNAPLVTIPSMSEDETFKRTIDALHRYGLVSPVEECDKDRLGFSVAPQELI